VDLLFEKYDTDGNNDLDLEEFRIFLKGFIGSEENTNISED